MVNILFATSQSTSLLKLLPTGLILVIITISAVYHHRHLLNTNDNDLTVRSRQLSIYHTYNIVDGKTTNEQVNNKNDDDNDHRTSSNSISSHDHHHHDGHRNIPHTLIFTSREDILKTKRPRNVYNNIMKTIHAYAHAWANINNNNPTTPLSSQQQPPPPPPPISILFFDDSSCLSIISQAAPQLIPLFSNEQNHIRRADICRIAALYVYGGYYFDVDLELISPVILADDVSFASVIQSVRGDFFQAFVACEKGHPVLRQALNFMRLEYYITSERGGGGGGGVKGGKVDVTDAADVDSNNDERYFLGPTTLKQAYDALSPEQMGGRVVILEEINLERNVYRRHYYPDVVLREGYGCCCNYVVHDPITKVIYFYSRIMGYSKRCAKRPFQFQEKGEKKKRLQKRLQKRQQGGT